MQNSVTTAAYYNWYEDQPTNTDAEDCVFMVGVDHGSKKKITSLLYQCMPGRQD